MLIELRVDALRGATQPFSLGFEKGKKITILFGENGSGKSTICDAFELISSGKVGSLEGKGLGQTYKFWPSTGKGLGDIEVVLKTSNREWVARIEKRKVIVSPDDDRPQALVLRRSQMLDLIEQQPKDRFDAIRPFLDVGSVEISEANLRKLLDEEKDNSEIAVARIEENRAAVETFWNDAGRPKTDCLTWARGELAKGTTQHEAELEYLRQLVEEIDRVDSEWRRFSEAKARLSTVEDALKENEEVVAREQSAMTERASTLVGILNAAKGYFHAHEAPEECPLCGSTEHAEGLPERVDEQLNAIRALDEALRVCDQVERKCQAARAQRRQQEGVLFEAAECLAKRLVQTEPVVGLAYTKEFVQAAHIFLQEKTTVDELIIEMQAFAETARAVRNRRSENIGFLSTLKQNIEIYDTNYATEQELEQLIPRLEAALMSIREERKRYVDEVLEKIALRVSELYEKIHPGEGLGKIDLLLDPKRRASLDIRSPFPSTEDAPPGAYFSESHLDTLGLCIWLALAELGGAENTILVIDDVVASVDDPHADRIIELLYEVAQDFHHCLLTTHYLPWKEKYRWGRLKSNLCNFIELKTWDHAQGMRHTKQTPAVEGLRELLDKEAPNVQQACASAGIILEAILDFLTELYECYVPRKKSALALGELLSCINTKLRVALRVEKLDGESGEIVYRSHLLKPYFDTLQNTVQARNVMGCHFNEIGQYLRDEDGLHFACNVLELADLLIDSECGWPRSDKSGSYWTNSQQTRRLHPLKKPS